MQTDSRKVNLQAFAHWKPLPLLSGAALFFSLACSTTFPLATLKSGIDSQYQLARWQKKGDFVKSPGIRFYQTILRLSLGSHCSLFPNDSAWSQATHLRCGAGIALFKSMARFYLEPDAPRLGLPIIEQKGALLREDLPNRCNLL